MATLLVKVATARVNTMTVVSGGRTGPSAHLQGGMLLPGVQYRTSAPIESAAGNHSSQGHRYYVTAVARKRRNLHEGRRHSASLQHAPSGGEYPEEVYLYRADSCMQGTTDGTNHDGLQLLQTFRLDLRSDDLSLRASSLASGNCTAAMLANSLASTLEGSIRPTSRSNHTRSASGISEMPLCKLDVL